MKPQVHATGLTQSPIPSGRFGEGASSLEPGLDEREMVINFGPQHPAMHGTLRMVLTLDGEKVKSAVPEIGYLHTGFEKLAEYRTYKEACDSLEQRAARYGQQGWIGIVMAYWPHPLGNRNAPGDPVTDAPGHGENTTAVCRELKHVDRVVRQRGKYSRPADAARPCSRPPT